MSGRDRGSDAPAKGQPAESSHNPFSDIWHKTTSAVSSVAHSDAVTSVKDHVVRGAVAAKDKAVQISEDPEVRATVKKGAGIATRVGTGVAGDMAKEGKGVVADAQNGNVEGLSKRAVPLILGGGLPGLVVKEVAPSVMKHGMAELPAGARQKIEGSGVGTAVVRQIERGNIPTSPTDIPRMLVNGAKDQVIHNAKEQVVRGAVDQVKARTAGGGAGTEAGRGYEPRGTEGTREGQTIRKFEERPKPAGAAAEQAKPAPQAEAPKDGKGNILTSGAQKVGSWLHLNGSSDSPPPPAAKSKH